MSNFSVVVILVLLEDDALGGLVIKCKTTLQVLQNLNVKVPIHPPINLASIVNPLAQLTPSNHQIFSTKLQVSFVSVRATPGDSRKSCNLAERDPK